MLSMSHALATATDYRSNIGGLELLSVGGGGGHGWAQSCVSLARARCILTSNMGTDDLKHFV